MKKKLGQSRLSAIVEAVCNVGSGMFIAFGINQFAAAYAHIIREYIWSGFVWTIGFEANIIMTIVLTVVSVSRSYVWRRIFNNIHVKNLHKGEKDE